MFYCSFGLPFYLLLVDADGIQEIVEYRDVGYSKIRNDNNWLECDKGRENGEVITADKGWGKSDGTLTADKGKVATVWCMYEISEIRITFSRTSRNQSCILI